MALLSNALSFARAQAQTDSNGLTDAKGVIFGNEALLDGHRMLIEHGIDASQVQESYQNATAGQGTYLYPSDMYFLKAIEVNYTDTNTNNYLTAEQVDASNLPNNISFSWLRNNQTTMSPLFDDRGDYFEIFPTPTAANNLSNFFRILYFLEPSEFSATSDTISYPFSLDYRILGWRIACSYLKSLANPLYEVCDKEYQAKMASLIKTLGRGVQQPLEATPIQNSGWYY